MAKPRNKLPDKSVTISCSACRTKLLRYRKGGTGILVKCFISRITKNFTVDPGICPNCQRPFGREMLIRGEPALKIIGGKVTVK